MTALSLKKQMYANSEKRYEKMQHLQMFIKVEVNTCFFEEVYNKILHIFSKKIIRQTVSANVNLFQATVLVAKIIFILNATSYAK